MAKTYGVVTVSLSIRSLPEKYSILKPYDGDIHISLSLVCPDEIWGTDIFAGIVGDMISLLSLTLNSLCRYDSL